MIKKVIILIALFGGTISSQNTLDSSTRVICKGKKNKFAVSLESNFMQVSSNLNFKRAGLNGSLGLDYYLTNRFYAGLFYSKMRDISKANTLYVIDQKVIDISTSEFSNYGIEAGYRLFHDERLNIIPELRFGYGVYKANSANFGINSTKNTLNIDMLTLCPRVNFLYSLTNFIDLGLTGGYLFPIYTNRSSFNEYNLQNINVGIQMKVYL